MTEQVSRALDLGHQGFREAPIRVKDKDIYIRGDRVFKSILFTFEFELFRA